MKKLIYEPNELTAFEWNRQASRWTEINTVKTNEDLAVVRMMLDPGHQAQIGTKICVVGGILPKGFQDSLSDPAGPLGMVSRFDLAAPARIEYDGWYVTDKQPRRPEGEPETPEIKHSPYTDTWPSDMGL